MERKYLSTPVPSTTATRKTRQPNNQFPQERPPDKAKPSPPATMDSSIGGWSAAPKKIYGFLTHPVNPLPLFFIFIMIRILASDIHNKNRAFSIHDLRNSISQAIYNPETINMLMAASPYLDVPEQEGLYTIIGILEAIQILNGIREGSYQAQRMQQIPVLGLENENRNLGIIKALKDYMPESSRSFIDSAIQLHESIEKLINNIKIYRNNLKIAGNRKPNPIEDLGEIIKVIKPVLPDEQQSKLERLQKVIQIAQVMDLDERIIKNREINANKKDDKDSSVQGQPEKNDITTDATDHDDGKDEYPAQKETDYSDAQQTASNDGQSQSLEMLIKLIQLLMQPSAKTQ